jgi:hypothetical protein
MGVFRMLIAHADVRVCVIRHHETIASFEPPAASPT